MTRDICLPVVYGRTHRVDQWWRVLPREMDGAWARETVMTATAGGAGLDGGRRLLLAQHERFRLIGGACLARDLSATMNSDGRRPLYCFVGWAVDLREGRGEVPACSELAAHFEEWAAPVYERWMTIDWDLYESELGKPHDAQPESAPWEAPRPARRHRGTEPVYPNEAVAWPSDQAEVAWDAVRLSQESRLITVGWRYLEDAKVSPGAWYVADDVSEVTVLHTAVRAASASATTPESPERPESPTSPHHTGVQRTSESNSPQDYEIDPWQMAGRIPPSADDLTPPPRPARRERNERDEGGGLRGVLSKLRHGLTTRLDAAGGDGSKPAPAAERGEAADTHDNPSERDERSKPPGTEAGTLDDLSGKRATSARARPSTGAQEWHERP
jgi:hypothetical protein